MDSKHLLIFIFRGPPVWSQTALKWSNLWFVVPIKRKDVNCAYVSVFKLSDKVKSQVTALNEMWQHVEAPDKTVVGPPTFTSPHTSIKHS